MSFGPELFTAIARSFEESVLPCRIGKIETGDTWAAFRLSSGKDRWFLFSWNPGSYGCGLVGEDGIASLKKTRGSRSSFGEALKRNLQNASILSVRQLNRDRVLVFAAERLVGADLYVTLEPCPMCAAAMAAARVARLYYGAADPKSGGVAVGARVFSHPQCHHVPEVYDGIGGDQAAALLKGFFQDRRGDG